jgi:ribosomal protein S19
VELKLDDNILLSFKDYMLDKNDLTTFSRKLKTQEYLFEEGKLILKKIEKKTNFLKKTNKSNYLTNKFITMDLETRIINEEMTSYCVSIYDGKIFKSFYLKDYLNEKEMLRSSIKFILRRKYHNHRVFLHNFSRFDAIFLLSVLTDLSEKVDPIIRNSKYIDLSLEFGGFYKIYFRDSLLLLPSNLRSLAKNFNVEDKGLFPYRFVNNQEIKLDYEGRVPEFKYFEGVTSEEYEEYCKEFINKP